jgi:amidase
VIGEPLGVDFVLTRSVRDAHAMLRVVGTRSVSGGDGSAGGAPVAVRPLTQRLRIALVTAPWSGVPVHPEVVAATEAAADMLEWIGHTVERRTPGLAPEHISDATLLGVMSAARAILHAPVVPRTDLLECASQAILRDAASFGTDEADRSLAAQRTITETMTRFWDDVDVLITPTLAQLPPPHGTLARPDARLRAVHRPVQCLGASCTQPSTRPERLRHAHRSAVRRRRPRGGATTGARG